MCVSSCSILSGSLGHRGAFCVSSGPCSPLHSLLAVSKAASLSSFTTWPIKRSHSHRACHVPDLLKPGKSAVYLEVFKELFSVTWKPPTSTTSRFASIQVGSSSSALAPPVSDCSTSSGRTSIWSSTGRSGSRLNSKLFSSSTEGGSWEGGAGVGVGSERLLSSTSPSASKPSSLLRATVKMMSHSVVLLMWCSQKVPLSRSASHKVQLLSTCFPSLGFELTLTSISTFSCHKCRRDPQICHYHSWSKRVHLHRDTNHVCQCYQGPLTIVMTIKVSSSFRLTCLMLAFTAIEFFLKHVGLQTLPSGATNDIPVSAFSPLANFIILPRPIKGFCTVVTKKSSWMRATLSSSWNSTCASRLPKLLSLPPWASSRIAPEWPLLEPQLPMDWGRRLTSAPLSRTINWGFCQWTALTFSTSPLYHS